MIDYIATYWAAGMLLLLLYIYLSQEKEDSDKDLPFIPHDEVKKPLLDRRFTFDDYKNATVHELLKDYKAFDLYVLGFITEKELDILENGRL
jgi:hypothetical protein